MPVCRPLSTDLQSKPQLISDWADFAQQLNQIEAALMALPDFTSFRVEGPASGYIGLVTAPDLRRKFSNISWTLTGESFDNGGVGQIKSNWDDPVRRTVWISGEQQTRAADFGIYALHPWKSGLIYLALHETAHVTQLGIKSWSDCWEAHKAAGGNSATYPNSLLWKRNEQLANSVVRAVCLQLSLPQLTSPSEGYLP